MFMLNGNPLPIDTPFEVDGIQYPANWLRLTSLAEKVAIGITEVSDPESYDDRFYWGVGNPKDLEQLKKDWISQVKDTAGKMLAQTDWMIIRKMERNVDVSADVVAKRLAILAEVDRLETAINACADVESLIAVVGSQNWGQND